MADDPRPVPTRHDTGSDSISVSELLQRHGQLTPPLPDEPGRGPMTGTFPLAPNGAIGALGEAQSPIDSGQLFITELLRREGRLDEPPPQPPRPARSYKPMVVATALLLVCGVATAGIAALAADRDDRPNPDTVATVELLRGSDALLPDVIQTTIDGVSALAGAAAIGATTPPPENLDATTDAVTGVVTEFFQTAPTAPGDAYQLLDPALRGAGVEDFTGSWEGVRLARIESVERDDQDVRVAVGLMRDDGTTLWLVEQLRVQSDRIVDATLLSAAVAR